MEEFQAELEEENQLTKNWLRQIYIVFRIWISNKSIAMSILFTKTTYNFNRFKKMNDIKL
jgi:hypothetical protein